MSDPVTKQLGEAVALAHMYEADQFEAFFVRLTTLYPPPRYDWPKDWLQENFERMRTCWLEPSEGK